MLLRGGDLARRHVAIARGYIARSCTIVARGHIARGRATIVFAARFDTGTGLMSMRQISHRFDIWAGDVTAINGRDGRSASASSGTGDDGLGIGVDSCFVIIFLLVVGAKLASENKVEAANKGQDASTNGTAHDGSSSILLFRGTHELHGGSKG